MRKLFMNITLIGAFLIGSISFAGETYESEEARFRITFPTDFEEEVEEEDGTTTISLSCVYGGMILIGTISIMEEAIPEDENSEAEASTLLAVASALGSKINKKFKSVSIWDMGEEIGFINALKVKLDKTKYIGNYYVIIVEDVEYQFTILAEKKAYDTGVEARFINSFAFLD